MRVRITTALAILGLAGAFLAGCDDFFTDTSNCSTVIVNAPVTSMQAGQTQQFTATCNISGGGTQDVTSTANWSSSDTTKATVNGGFVIGVAPGTATISASSSGVTGSTNLTINQPALSRIDITPLTQTIAHGSTFQFTATGTFSDNTTRDITAAVTWTSSNPAAATIANSPGSAGLATGVGAVQSTNISATLGTVVATANATLNVT